MICLALAASDAGRSEAPPEPPDRASTSGLAGPSAASLIWHATDSSVKPIVSNRRIERLPEPQWDPRLLPFKPLVSGAATRNLEQQGDIETSSHARWGGRAAMVLAKSGPASELAARTS